MPTNQDNNDELRKLVERRFFCISQIEYMTGALEQYKKDLVEVDADIEKLTGVRVDA